MKKTILLTFIFLVVLSVGVFAEWWNPFSWFDEEDGGDTPLPPEKPITILYKNKNMTIEFKDREIIIGQATLKSHKTYDEILKVTTGKNRTVVWYEFSDFKNVQIDALKSIEFIDIRKYIFNKSIKGFIEEFEMDKFIISNPNYLLPINKSYHFVYLENEEWFPYNSLDIPKENIILGVQIDLGWREILDVVWIIFENKLSNHAVVIGTSAGFVEVAPTSDPEGENSILDNEAQALKEEAPAGATRVIEIGWYSNQISEAADTTVGIYTHNATDDEPETLLGSATFAKGTTEGWKIATGLDIPITAGTTYWIAAQCDNTVTSTFVDYSSDSERKAYKTSQTTLTNPWGTSTGFYTSISAIYAVWESIIPPSFLNNQTNASSTTYNSTDVQINLTIKDDLNISAYTLTHNDTSGGTWTNESIINLAGDSNVTMIWNYTISYFSNSGTLGWRVWANNSAGNANVSQIYILTVQFTEIFSIGVLDSVGYGYNVTINTTIIDSDTVNSTWVKITFPNSTSTNHTMSSIGSDKYQYNLTDTWQYGTHNFTIYYNDSLNNVDNSSDNFNVSVSATIGTQTIKDTYIIGEQINLTDPPPLEEPEASFYPRNKQSSDLLDDELALTEYYVDVIVYFKSQPIIKYKEILEEEAKEDFFRILTGFFVGEEKSINNFIINKVENQKEKIKKEQDDIQDDLDFIPEHRWNYLVSGVSGKIKNKDIEELKILDFVDKVEKDTELNMLLDVSVPLINADEVWKINTTGINITGLGVKVAILDSGIDYEHPFFGNCSAINITSGNCPRIEYMYDFYNDDTDAFDDHYHGTHVAGIVGGADSSGTYTGVAPNVTFIIYKVCSAGGSCPSSDIISALENATAYGVDIISISLGATGDVDTSNALYIAMNSTNNAGIIQVVAVGNRGASPGSITIPGNYPFVVGVGATKNDDTINSFSGRGFAYYTNGSVAAIKPDIVAPGYLITSSWPVRYGEPSNVYAISGTSMATPHISGVVALLIQAYPDWDVSQLKSALANSAKILSSYNPNDVGSGRVDALQAYNISAVVVPHNRFMGENINILNANWSSLKNFSVYSFNESLTISLSVVTTDTYYVYTLNTTTIILAPNETKSFSLNVSTNNNVSRYQNTWARINFSINTSDRNYIVPIGMKDAISSPGCAGVPFYINGVTTFENVSCLYPISTGYSVFIINSSDSSLTCKNSSVTGIDLGSAVYGNNIDNFTMTGCNFSNFNTPISIHDSSNISIINNTISQSFTFGLFGVIDDLDYWVEGDTVGVDGLNILGNTFFNATRSASILWDSGLIIRSSNDILIDGNNFSNSYSRGLMIYGPIWNASAGSNTAGFVNSNATISNNYFEWTRQAIDIANFKDTEIINNRFHNVYLILLRESTENSLVSNDIIGNDSLYNPNWTAGILIGRQESFAPWAEASINETIKKTNISVVFVALGVYETENLEFEDSVIHCTDIDDDCINFYSSSAGGASVIMVNTSFDESKIEWDDRTGKTTAKGNITVKWWGNIAVNDTSNNILSDANVIISENSSGTWSSVYSGTTGADGILHNAKIPQKIINLNETNITTIFYHINISVSKDGYFSNSTTFYNLSDNTYFSMTLESNLTTKSMINNTGTNNFKGYLTLKVQKNISGVWTDYKIVTNNILIDVNTSAPFALDVQWYTNGSYTANSTGTFKAFVELKAKNGSLLTTNDGEFFNASYEFVVQDVIFDTTSPAFSSDSTNASITTYNSTDVQINLTIEDDSNISAYTLSTNDTSDGSWTNETIINLDGLGNITMIWNYTVSFFQNSGTLGWRVWANDTVNNSGVSDIYTFFVYEIETPKSNISINNTSPRINDVVNISMNVSDNFALDFCWFYNNMSNKNSSVISLSRTSDNSLCFNVTTINVTHTDVLFRGYVNDTSNNLNWSDITITIANSIPTVPTITSPNDGEINNTRKIDFYSTDADGDSISYTIYINNTLNITTNVNISIWNGSDGYYNLTMTANDSSDVSANSSVIYFTLDTTPPIVTIIYPVNNSNISSNSIDLNASVIDNFNTSSMSFYYVINGTTNSTTTQINSTFNASDGYYNLTLFVSDGLQNGSSTIFFRLDTTSPSFSSDSTNASSDTYNASDVQINLTLTDGIGIDYYRLSTTDTVGLIWANESLINADDVITLSPIFNHTIENFGLAGETFSWRVWSNDTLGNSGVSSIYTFTVNQLDTTEPTVNIIFPSNNSNINSNSIDLNASAVDDYNHSSMSFYWFINSTLNSTTVQINSTFNASDGYYNLTLFVSDGLQNGSDTVFFTLDTIEPSFSSNSTNSSNTVYRDTVQINLTITDRIGLDFYRLATTDTGTWANESLIDAEEVLTVSPIFNYSISSFSLSGGTFNWMVWANDTSGNSNTSNIYSFLIINSTPRTIEDTYLDLYDIWVNELIGDLWLFVFLGLILIWFLAAKGSLTTEVSMLLAILFLAAIFAKTGLTILWVFSVLGVGTIFYYKISKIIRQG